MAISRINMSNYGVIEGRLTRDPQVIKNNGGTTYLFTVATDRDYTDKSGNRPTDFVSLKGFVAKGRNVGPYAYLEKGKQVKVSYDVQSYREVKNGETIYGMTLHVNDIRLGNSPKAAQKHAPAQKVKTPVKAEPATEYAF